MSKYSMIFNGFKKKCKKCIHNKIEEYCVHCSKFNLFFPKTKYLREYLKSKRERKVVEK